MIVELGVGFLAVGAAGYAVHRCRGQVKRAGLRGEQLRRLKWPKEKIEGGR